MPISLTKGQKVDLTKGNPGLKNIMVGLGWDVNEFDTGYDFDLDASAFMLGSNGRCPTEKEFIFYGNLEHSSGAVKHMGDNLTGEGEGYFAVNGVLAPITWSREDENSPFVYTYSDGSPVICGVGKTYIAVVDTPGGVDNLTLGIR